MRRAGVLFLVLLVCYAYFLPRWAEWNQNSRMDLTMAIVEQGTFVIDDYYGNTGDYAVYGGHVYTDKAPGASFVGVPAYAAFRALARLPVVEQLLERVSRTSAFQATLREGGTGLLEEKVRFAAALYFVTFFSITLPSALLGVLLYRFLGHVLPSPGLRWLLVLAYGLGTIAWPYSTVFYGHQLAAVLLFGAFYLAWRVRRGTLRPRALWAVGALLGLTVLVEFPALPAAALLTLYTLRPETRKPGTLRPLLPILLAALPFALLLGYYNATCFGSPFTSSYRYLANFPEISGYGFLGFGPPRLEALWGITFSPYRGLFYLSPFLLLALPGFWAWVKEREWRVEGLLAGAFVGVQFFLITCWYDWRGGFAIGPRNLLLILPYLVVAVAFFLRRWGARAWGRFVFGGLVALSFVMTGVAATAGQLFPSVTIASPWTEYWWPRFIAGDITRNLGMAVGLPGLWSLLPLPIVVGVGVFLAWRWR
ncbi:MAG TPA: hypothetical protein G4O00_03695 [Thermoflexia bacterium]|nr:hypothetical protein [Thermoflexia bacterium]